MPLDKIIRGVKSIIDNPKPKTTSPKATPRSNQSKASAAADAYKVPGRNAVRNAKTRTQRELEKMGE